MPVEFRCIQCQKLLRVSDEAVGKKARCPDCGTIQEVRDQAAAGFHAAETPPTELPPAGRESPPNPYADQSDWGASAAPTANPYQSPQTELNAPGMSVEMALTRVQAPATGILIVGGIILAFQLLAAILIVGTAAFGEVGFAELITNLLGLGTGIGISALMVIGALKMRRLESYALSMTAAIMAMLPCSGCCVISIPFGIWALVVLLDPQVKAAFRQ